MLATTLLYVAAALNVLALLLRWIDRRTSTPAVEAVGAQIAPTFEEAEAMHRLIDSLFDDVEALKAQIAETSYDCYSVSGITRCVCMDGHAEEICVACTDSFSELDTGLTETDELDARIRAMSEPWDGNTCCALQNTTQLIDMECNCADCAGDWQAAMADQDEQRASSPLAVHESAEYFCAYCQAKPCNGTCDLPF